MFCECDQSINSNQKKIFRQKIYNLQFILNDELASQAIYFALNENDYRFVYCCWIEIVQIN